MPPKPRYDEDDAISALQKAEKDTDKYLSKRRYRQWRKKQGKNIPSTGTIIQVLGTGWPECLEEAGIETDDHVRGYSKKEIDEALEQAVEEKGKRLTKLRYKKYREDASQKLPSVGTIANKYENWSEALESNGIEVVGRGDPLYDEDDFVDAVREAADAKGEPLRQKDYREYSTGKTGVPSDSTIVGYRYSWIPYCTFEISSPAASDSPTSRQFLTEAAR